MSRAAQEVARQVKEMASRKRRRPVDDDNDSTTGQSDQIDDVTAGEAAADSPVTADEGDNVAKAKKAKSGKKSKSAAKTVKAAKTAKAPKAPKAAKVRDVETDSPTPRKRVPAGGELNGVVAKGDTYIELQFTEGYVTLTPTSNRQHNRDLVVATLQKLLG